MALRCFLVSLVACFGFEIPTPCEVTSWTASGRTWLSARSSEIAAFRVEATDWLLAHDPAAQVAANTPLPGLPPDVRCTECPRVEAVPTPAEVVTLTPDEVASDPADAMFEAVATTIIDGFAADITLATRDEQLAPALEAEFAGDATVPTDSLVAANRLLLVQPTPVPDIPAPAIATEISDSRSGAAEQLSSAVRLTHEAVQAWAALARAIGADDHLLR